MYFSLHGCVLMNWYTSMEYVKSNKGGAKLLYEGFVYVMCRGTCPDRTSEKYINKMLISIIELMHVTNLYM